MFHLFDLILIQPTTNLLLFFHYIFLAVHLPFAFGFSIVGLTVLIRLILHPIFYQQIAMAKKMEEVKPHMDKLNEKHKDDKKKLQEEQMKLYRELGINPASGCLFAIVQIPVFLALYQVLQKFISNGAHPEKMIEAINKMAYAPFLRVQSLDPHFFGLNLWASPSQFNKYGWIYLLIPVLTGFLQYLQVSVASPKKKVLAENEIVKKDDKDKKANSSEDMQKMMSTQMKYMFPVMIGYFSYTLPIGLSLYWNLFSLFSIAQYVMYHKKNNK
jgi:YidC/Oxa1 family membrane protein insertase